MADKKKLYKRLALAVIVVGVLFPVKYLQSSDNAFHRAVVFTDPIMGDWNCVIPPAGGAPQLTVIKSIHVGGTESEIDNAAPPSQESPTVGTWTKSGPLTYSQNAYQMSWDPSGSLIGTWHYTGPLALSSSLNDLSIQGTATLVDPSGNVIISFPFTATCTRL